MRWIIRGSLRLRFLPAFAAMALIHFGLDQIKEMRVDVFPEFAPPLVEIQTEAIGLSTEESEALVTVPLEQAFSGIPQLETMRSKTVPGLSSIVLIFERGTDLMLARQQVQERLAQAQPLLPNVARPPVILQPLSATSRVMKIGVSSSTISLVDMSEIYRWKIRPRLMSVRGVANVAAWGQRKRQLQVQVDPDRLRALGITLNQVMESTSDALSVGLLAYKKGAKTGTGGFIDASARRIQVRHILPVVTPEDLARVSIETADGRKLRLSDVAKVVEGHPPLIGDGIVNDGPGLLLVVEKFPWANTLEVTEGVEEALEEMQPGLPGIAIDSTIFRPATFIELSIHNLTRALLVGSFLVVLVLLAFLYEWRAALISLVAIPLSLLTAILVLSAYGATVNTMILAGFAIALGEVVDDAIIDIENIMRRLRENRAAGSPRPAARVILDASLEIRSAVVYATLIITLAISPVFFMSGLSGAFFQPLATAYVLALLASMVVALTLTPALSLILLAHAPLERRESPLVRWLQHAYQGVLARILAVPRAAMGATAAMVLVGLAMLPLLGQSLLPAFKERDFLMHWVTKPGTSYPEMSRITIASSTELRAIPGVRNFGAHIGQAAKSDEVVGINFTENWISVDPAADYDATLARIQEVVDGYPGLYRDVLTYLKERIREVLTGSSQAIVVRIYGPDLQTLRSQADEVKQALAGIPGMIDLHTELQEDIPHIAVKVDLAKAERHGIKPGDVRRAAALLVGGIEVSDIYQAANLYDVTVWGVPETRSNLTHLREMLIDTPSGGHVRLGDVADVRILPTPNFIRRENVSRRIDVSANVSGRDLGSVVADVERRLQTIAFPLEYHAELVGEYAERQAAQARLFGFALAAAAGIFLLLQACFGSWRLAVMAFLALPSALVGGVLASFAGGGVISLGSLVGLLTVLGIASRNGILLINHYQHLEREEGERFGPGLILRGARERLRPILMTALTTGLAISPLVLFGQIPGHEIEHPMAVVILGGLVTSTLLNLFVVPTLYARFGRRDAGVAAGPAPSGNVSPAPA
jgi:CzcA family heavy metal efflux pump